ncbi:MAG: hypothetical protein GY796_22030 [Chloroflexi bacterium]|nr:hypothetical protein [Chloroflexota bacterium]
MYITQDLFSASALTIAMAHFLGQDSGQVAREAEAIHCRTYSDTGLYDELVVAAENITIMLPIVLEHTNPTPQQLAKACGTLIKAISEYDEKGRRRNRFTRGAWFNRLKAPLNDKIERCKQDIILYHFMLLNGKIDVLKLK